MSQRHCMIVHGVYPPAETRVERQVDSLLAEGRSVDVICLRQSGAPVHETRGNLAIYRLPVRRHKRRGALIQLLEYVTFFFLVGWRLLWTGHRYATIQVHTPPDFLVFAALVPKLRGVKLILDIHDLMPEFYQERFDTRSNHPVVGLVRLQERWSCRIADRVITVSEYWRQILDMRCGTTNKSSVVMNIPGPRFTSHITQTVTTPQVGETIYLIYHGNITYRYGLDVVLSAMHRILPDAPEIRFIIRGEGDYLPLLQVQITQLGLEAHVQVVREALPTEQLPRFLSQAHVGVVPYRNGLFTDGIIPTKLLEYTFLGLPSIVSRTTAIQDYFDASMVKFVTPGDVESMAESLLDIYRHPEQLVTLRGNLSRFTSTYRWEEQAKAYLHLCQTANPSPPKDPL